MNDYNFMPSVEMRIIDDTLQDSENYGLTKGVSDIDMDEMNQYVHFVMNIRTRTPEGNKDNIKFFRPCRIEDFTSNGIDMNDTKVALKKINHRLCPDFKKDDPDFAVINGFTNEQLRQHVTVAQWVCNEKFSNYKCKNAD
jgi:hypothetical protein